MKNEFDIIALGIVAMDYYLFMDTFSADREKIWAHSANFFPGGTMGNFAAAASRLGLKTGFVGVGGKDLFGELLKRDFEACGVDTSNLIIRAQGQTPVPVIIQDRAEVRTVLIPPFMHLKRQEVDFDYLKKAGVLHTHLFDYDLCLLLSRTMKENGTMFSLDLELHRILELSPAKLNKLLRQTQLLFCNRETLQYLEPGPETAGAARRLRERGPEMVVVTLGSEGSLAVSSSGKAVQVSSPVVEVVDATGAGDCFSATFFYGYLKKWPLKKCLAYASAAAASVVQQFGARAGQPSLDQFLSFGDTFFKPR